mmetsp:Transcript_56341/g.127835  ORF Transcript_56341/g.127835 Transcript_56341/m.127835 type:complete len:221 (+) Transcript_56341:237-899(+)
MIESQTARRSPPPWSSFCPRGGPRAFCSRLPGAGAHPHRCPDLRPGRTSPLPGGPGGWRRRGPARPAVSSRPPPTLLRHQTHRPLGQAAQPTPESRTPATAPPRSAPSSTRTPPGSPRGPCSSACPCGSGPTSSPRAGPPPPFPSTNPPQKRRRRRRGPPNGRTRRGPPPRPRCPPRAGGPPPPRRLAPAQLGPHCRRSLRRPPRGVRPLRGPPRGPSRL